MKMDFQRAAYTTARAAELLSCHPETLRRAIRSGDLPAQDGRPYRISAVELKKWWRATGGGELRLPGDRAGDPDDLRRIKNPVDVGSADDMARRISDALETLRSLCRSLSIEAERIETAQKEIDAFRQDLQVVPSR